MNYLVRAMWVILIAFSLVSFSVLKSGWTPLNQLIRYDSQRIKQIGLGMLASLIILHILFH